MKKEEREIKKIKKQKEKQIKKLKHDAVKRAKREEGKTEKEKVESRREEVLSRGRKFKYPLQYAKYRLIFITIIVAVLAVAAGVAAGWIMLYKVQDTSDMLYRITQTVPLPVARVDGENVLYSDYLMIYKSSLKTVEQQSGKLGNDDEANLVRERYKRTALNNAEEYTFAEKKARDLHITVSAEEVQNSFDEHRKVGGVERSEESFLKILNDNFGFERTEYERMLYLSLIRSKVMAEVDTEAKKTVSEVEKKLSENGGDLRKVAEELGDKVQYEETGGLVNAYNIDGGRATKAMTLSDGELSKSFVSNNGDGCYFVKLINKTESQVNYISLKIPFKKFMEDTEKLRANGKIEEFIEIR